MESDDSSAKFTMSTRDMPNVDIYRRRVMGTDACRVSQLPLPRCVIFLCLFHIDDSLSIMTQSLGVGHTCGVFNEIFVF